MVGLVGPLYNILYLATLDWHPGFAYCVSSIILIVMILMTIYCRWYEMKWAEMMELRNLDCNISRNPTFFANGMSIGELAVSDV